jgi:uncharacterized membrane protein (Fun14 family)
MFTKLHTEIAAQAKSVGDERPPWQARSVWVALALMLLGGGLWVQDRTQPKPASATAPPGASQFSDSASTLAQSGGGHELKPAAPATFRFGASYIGGFFLGWTFRRFLKVTLLLSGVAIVLIALGKKLGWLELDWVAIEGQVRQSQVWLHGEAGAFKQFLTGYLPSAGAAGVGAFLGFRRK